MVALRNLLVRVGADLSGFEKGMTRAGKRLQAFHNQVMGFRGGIAGALASGLAGIGTGLLLHQAVEDATKYEALMGTLSESMGQSIHSFQNWQKEVGSTLGFSKLQGAELANTLSLNFKKIATDHEDLVGKTTKMMEIAGRIAIKRGMTMQEVSDRIRSAMNQEADGNVIAV